MFEEQIATDKDDNDNLSDPSRREEQIEKWLKQNDAKIGSTGKELKSNITDNESAMMTTSHGTIQGYNGQALAAFADAVLPTYHLELSTKIDIQFIICHRLLSYKQIPIS